MEKQKLKLEPWEDEKEEKIYNCFKEIDSDEDDYIPVTDQSNFTIQKPHISQKRSAIRLVTEKAGSGMKLLRQLIQDNRWQEILQNQNIKSKDVAFIGVEKDDDHYYLAKQCYINKIPGLTALGDKKVLALIMRLNQKYITDDSSSYLPKSFQWPEETDLILSHINKHKKHILISKPSGGAQGEGIQLIRKAKDIDRLKKEAIVQQYIANPLILNKRKFDLRLYVMISSVFPFVTYLNNEGLARFCTEDYQSPSADNINNHYIHLTNYSLNKMSENYIHNEETTECHDGSKMTLCSLWKLFEKEGYKQSDRESIEENIKEIVTDLMNSIAPFVQQSFREEFGLLKEQKEQTQKLNKCFHVVGVDVLIDSDFKAWLLEINANASFQVDYEGMSSCPMDKKNKAIFSPIDYYVKSRAMGDAIKLVRKKKQDQIEIGIGEWFNSYQQLSVQEEDENNIFDQIALLFQKLKGGIYKQYLNSNKFRKLGDMPNMTTDKLTKNSYELLFQKCMQGKDDFRNMGYFDFISIMEELQLRLEQKFSDIESMIHHILKHL